jgi:hypothetical protein
MLAGTFIQIKSFGPIGISDSSGQYTYYNTLSSAAAAATAGDTIVFFTNIVESGAVTVVIPDQVDVNLNGYSYTLDNAGIDNAIETIGVSTNSIYNGEIIRLNGSDNLADSVALRVSTTSTLNLDYVIVRNDTGNAIYMTESEITGSWKVLGLRAVYVGGTGSFDCILRNGDIQTTTDAINAEFDIVLFNCIIRSGGKGINGTLDVAIYNSVITAIGGNAVDNSAAGAVQIENSNIISTTGIAVYGGDTGGVFLRNSNFFTLASSALFVPLSSQSTVEVTHCTFFGLAGTCLNIQSGIRVSVLYNKVFISTAGTATGILARGFSGSSVDVSYNHILAVTTSVTSAGTGILFSTNAAVSYYAKQNDISVLAVSATSFCIGGIITAFVAGNMLLINNGGSPIGPNVTQAMVSTPDLYGNTQII